MDIRTLNRAVRPESVREPSLVSCPVPDAALEDFTEPQRATNALGIGRELMELSSRRISQTAPRSSIPTMAAIALCVTAVACAGGRRPEPSVTDAGHTTVNQSPGSEYVVGPGDTLRIFVLRNPELSSEVPVRPDGKISTPLASDIVAVGKTTSELARDLEKALSEYVRSPTVSVIVAQPASVFSQVKVVGQAVHPQAIAFRNGMTVLDVIIQVGGLSQFAAGNRAKIIRTQDGKTIEIRVRLEDLLNRGDVSQNFPMNSGDLLVIPESRF
jgi:polysaccharide export outer membrane protein